MAPVPLGTQDIPLALPPRNYLKVQQVRQHQPPLWEKDQWQEPFGANSCELTGTQNPQVLKEATEKQAADPKLLNLPLQFQSLWLKQLPEASLCPKAQPWSSLVWGWSSPGGAPAAAALALLSGEVGAALGLAGRCGDSTQLGKATVARFQARHGSPGMGQNRCAVRKAAIKG